MYYLASEPSQWNMNWLFRPQISAFSYTCIPVYRPKMRVNFFWEKGRLDIIQQPVKWPFISCYFLRVSQVSGYIWGHNFWTNWDLDLLSTSKWPQFCERWSNSWRKNGRKMAIYKVSFISKQSTVKKIYFLALNWPI